MHGHMCECECVCPRTHGEVMRVYAKYLWGIFQNVNREIVRTTDDADSDEDVNDVCARAHAVAHFCAYKRLICMQERVRVRRQWMRARARIHKRSA